MVRRRRIVFISTLATATAVIGVGYLQTRSTWRTATEAEVRQVFDPALLVEQKPDPAARERYERMMRALQRLQLPTGYLSERARAMPRFLEDKKAQVAEIEAILAGGFLARPDAAWREKSILPSTRLTPAIKIFVEAAQLEANAGRTESATRLFRLALGLAYAFTGHCVELTDAMLRDHYAGIVFRVLYPSLAKFNDSQLRQIAAAIPNAASADEDYRRAVRMQFQAKLLPALPDPRLQTREMTDDPDAPSDDALGSYDALATARFLNEALRTTMENCLRRRHQQYDAYVKRAAFLRLTLPTDRTPSARGLWIPVRRLQYRIQMARTSNSFARLSLFPTLESHVVYIDASYKGRTMREANRALIALHRYRLRTGASAPSLKALVDRELLPAVPADYWSAGELRYDSYRRRLWSAGEDGLDNGGVDFRLASLSAPDYIWRTP